MDLMAFNEAFLSGKQVHGMYPIRTSLVSPSEPTPMVQKPVPDAIRGMNQRPVAVAPGEMTVRCGQEFEIDGSRSYDPEGQPLYYRWSERTPRPPLDLHHDPVLKLKAPDKPATVEYRFWVLDGLRCSEPVTIKVEVVE